MVECDLSALLRGTVCDVMPSTLSLRRPCMALSSTIELASERGTAPQNNNNNNSTLNMMIQK